MKGKLNIREIAAQAGLSIATVSRVLAGKANTRAATREKVLAIARQHGVMENLTAGRLLLNNLLVFAPPRAFDQRTDIFYYKVIQGIHQALNHHDVRVRYCGIDELDSDAALFLQKMHQPETDAAIIVGIDDRHIHQLAAELNKPCVLINCLDQRMRLPAVSPDHQLIGHFSANYLFEQGHRQLLTLHCLRRYTMAQRLAGVRDAWRANNLYMDERRHLLTVEGFGSAEAEQRVSAWLQRTPANKRPTAILAGGDFMAMGAMSALQNAGLRVPQDISVMSMDGFNLAAIHDIALTSVQVPRNELGSEAVRVLQQRLLNPGGPCGNLLLAGKLVNGETVRRLRQQAPVRQEGLYE
ncbi:LacI family DNA-binding transcriptional regulator [Duffyella gerundensis]|uniref:LacI family DNA-binding transcriptional regulator n=1 Tax=Duffyella TaxID=3026546 RepID=UPI003F6DDFD8